jgi:hypothetical protein
MLYFCLLFTFVPSIYSLINLFFASERTVIIFLNLPKRCPLGLYDTLMTPLLPGKIGFLGKIGLVQPHDPKASFIEKGVSPVFVKTNSQDTIFDPSTTPKSKEGFLKDIKPSALEKLLQKNNALSKSKSLYLIVIWFFTNCKYINSILNIEKFDNL